MLANEDKRVLGEMTKQLESYAQALEEMVDFYRAAFDNLSETEQDHTEGEYLSSLVSDLEQVRDDMDTVIETVKALVK
jgi:methyl-accepting chemotaxis protein